MKQSQPLGSTVAFAVAVFLAAPEAGSPQSSARMAPATFAANPVADAYRAFRPMPHDAPSYDVAAAYYAVRPDSGFFRLSETDRFLFQTTAGCSLRRTPPAIFAN